MGFLDRITGWIAGRGRTVNRRDPRARRLDDLDALYAAEQYAGRGLAPPWDKAPKGAPKEPLRSQVPAVQFPLARVIVNRPVALLFGEGRFPRFTWEAADPNEAAGDADDEVGRWLTNLADEGHLPLVALTWARLGLTSGTAILTWDFVGGKVEFTPHRAAHCEPTFDPKTGGPIRRLIGLEKRYRFKRRVREIGPAGIPVMVERDFWHRELWDLTSHTVFEDAPVDGDEEPAWVVADVATHNFGLLPGVWFKALDDGDPGSVDGMSLLDGLPSLLESVDRTLTGQDRGVRYNTEPEKIYTGLPVDAGTKRPIAVGGGASTSLPTGADAKLLEIAGEGLRIAGEHVDAQRSRALEVARVVLPDSERLLAASKSGAALRILFAPTIELVGELRQAFGAALRTVFGQIVDLAMAGRLGVLPDGEGGDGTIRLAPPTRIPLGKVCLTWGHYFDPTPDDLVQLSTVASILKTAGIMDDASLVRLLAPYFGISDVEAVLDALEDQRAEQGREPPPGSSGEPDGDEGDDAGPAADVRED